MKQEAHWPALAVSFHDDFPSIEFKAGYARGRGPGDVVSVFDEFLLNSAFYRILKIDKELGNLHWRWREPLARSNAWLIPDSCILGDIHLNVEFKIAVLLAARHGSHRVCGKALDVVLAERRSKPEHDGLINANFVVGDAANDPIFVLAWKLAAELIKVDSLRCKLHAPADVALQHLEVHGPLLRVRPRFGAIIPLPPLWPPPHQFD